MPSLDIDKIRHAGRRIGLLIDSSRLLRSKTLSDGLNNNVYLKMESENETGSFKVRGAINKLSILQDEGFGKVVTASTGNHGAAVAFAGRLLKMEVVVYVPETINTSKLSKLEKFGVDVNKRGNDGIVAEKEARRFAAEQDIPYVSPYNDYEVIAGQGTIGLEIHDQLEPIDKVYVSLGGGGLAGGIGTAIKELNSGIELIACSPLNSPVMYESIRVGEILEMESSPTISDGTAGGLEMGSVTFDICRDVVDSHVLVKEELIRDATATLNHREGIKAEGAAGLALAGAILDLKKRECKSENVVVIVCGSNIDQSTLSSLA